VPEGGDAGADENVHYVAIEQHLDQSLEGPKANLTNEGKPRFIVNLCFIQIIQLSLLFYVHLHSGVDWNPSSMIPKYLWSFASIARSLVVML
jgi:hypothetical protein